MVCSSLSLQASSPQSVGPPERSFGENAVGVDGDKVTERRASKALREDLLLTVETAEPGIGLSVVETGNAHLFGWSEMAHLQMQLRLGVSNEILETDLCKHPIEEPSGQLTKRTAIVEGASSGQPC